MLVLLPLWSSYLVKVYAWRVILARAVRSNGSFEQIGIPGVVLYPSDIADGRSCSATSGCRT